MISSSVSLRLARLLASLTMVTAGHAENFVFNSDTLHVNGSGATRIKGRSYSAAVQTDGTAQFLLSHGDVTFDASDRVSFRGSRPVRLMVRGNLVIPNGMVAEADAAGTVAHAGGGAGGAVWSANNGGPDGGPLLPAAAGGAGGEGAAFVNSRPGTAGEAGHSGGSGGAGGTGASNPGAAGAGNPSSAGLQPQTAAAGLPGATGGGGTAGPGGPGATYGSPGGNGGPGGSGGDGGHGRPGANGIAGKMLAATTVLAGGGGGSSGVGGGGGAGGNAGGGGGGGGGGSSKTTFFGGGSGGAGGTGGVGGAGGAGGRGGDGGPGGGGGGAFEIKATGSITLAGTLSARGGDGNNAVPSSRGGAGSMGQSGALGNSGQAANIPDSGTGGRGGDGGEGGTGGTGGNGGAGGLGAGGAGGTIFLRGKGVTVTGTGRFQVEGGGTGIWSSAAESKGRAGRAIVQDTRVYRQNFDAVAAGATDCADFSLLTSNLPAMRGVSGGSPSLLWLTHGSELGARTQFVLPQLVPSSYGFTARFKYLMAKPASGPWADGMGFYLKPASAVVDVAGNQVGGYAQGLGVEFITFSNPRHQIRVNGTVHAVTSPVSPLLDGLPHDVLIEYRTAPGWNKGSLTLTVDGTVLLENVAITGYMPSATDVFAFTARTGGYAQSTLIDDIEVTPTVSDPRFYYQAFDTVADRSRDFDDGSLLTSDGGVAQAVAGTGDNFLLLTAAETPWTRSQYVLPPLHTATYGFEASFDYAIVKPGGGAPWADGFGFYLKPAAAAVDGGNQVGGYAQGVGVEFITFSNPRHQIRGNGAVVAQNTAVQPFTDGLVHRVKVTYLTAPGKTGSLTVTVDGQRLFDSVPVNYQPQPGDVFAFSARTGGYAETVALDDIHIFPITRKPAANLTIRQSSRSGDIVVNEVKWDTEPGGMYDLYVSTDLENWFFSRSYTASGNSLAISSVGSLSQFPRYFFRVARQQ